ncbi:uncharacterized protein MELLADRAFT_101249 [Melampsora larici-populina 98AG31]|uniref:Uncharacterized protein n=1 Tax=Melampsora larici-populina (strain 98AG31 / pathotype 3-4-7) TaxID=747676 RepID=F4R444_MELLP|nr:uncharacterized protein MELLADRAFT_101249 [Melampsora larici-populina 98AG31]EGG13056.1 hypothetical protein MELLADRAFT_101249 [Melampsora larici-populina 98AG31]
MLRIRESHDSQVSKGHGNERAKQTVSDIAINLTASEAEQLKPSMCSKLVAVMMKNHEAVSSATTRLHRWNITSKLRLADVIRNTSTVDDFPTDIDLGGGQVSTDNPLEHGKFVLLINNALSTQLLQADPSKAEPISTQPPFPHPTGAHNQYTQHPPGTSYPPPGNLYPPNHYSQPNYSNFLYHHQPNYPHPNFLIPNPPPHPNCPQPPNQPHYPIPNYIHPNHPPPPPPSMYLHAGMMEGNQPSFESSYWRPPNCSPGQQTYSQVQHHSVPYPNHYSINTNLSPVENSTSGNTNHTTYTSSETPVTLSSTTALIELAKAPSRVTDDTTLNPSGLLVKDFRL